MNVLHGFHYTDQAPYDCRIEWGPRGARAAAERGDIVIIVDVLSFSSTVVTALHYGALIIPYPPPMEGARSFAAAQGAELVTGRAEAAKTGGHSLSPLSFGSADRSRPFVLCSANGAACTAAGAAAQTAAVIAGSLLNASAAARAAERLRLLRPGKAVTVIACGERWDNARQEENSLRPAIEDYLGAGAILSGLSGSRSPEARLCAAAYEAVRSDVRALLLDCASGRELRLRGFEDDVTHCSSTDRYEAVPMLQGGRFVDASAPDALIGDAL
ncbi:2-phosphosulfolactate phosphatase [Paenibacillus doosanensis]|uniref:2-phosphosulfolactate phosphatase n=1 Tax=Paenibacillus doosanensis TaxID=1229154 RepID=UPI00218011E5|nr:2-phosphosulfolactate phosphatase [Paenibacillus doosanensis]MCS7462766.1 2-phosphosulfolactate phosphatase [Paenibacillus doosanensis]